MSKIYSVNQKILFPSSDSLAPKKAYRQSEFNGFEKCPAAWKMQYLDHVEPAFKSIEAFNGDVFHRVMEILYTRKMTNNQIMTYPEVLEMSQEVFKEDFAASEIEIRIIKENMNIDDYMRLSRLFVTNYYFGQYPFEGTPIIIEKEIEFKINGYRIYGHPDLVLKTGDTDTLTIVDYKTGKKPPSKAELELNIQLPVYEMAVRQETDFVGHIQLILIYTAPDQDENMKVFTFSRDFNQIEAVKQRILDRIGLMERAIELQDFPYRPSILCPWCPYSDTCDAYQEERLLRTPA